MISRATKGHAMDIQDLLEQRRAPRFSTELDAEIFSCDDSSERPLGSASVCNISSSGLQIECSMPQAAQLIPNQGQPGKIPTISLKVNFSVPTSAKDKVPVSITCDIIYIRRMTRETHQLGWQFREFHNNCNQDLEDFLQRFAISEPKPV